MTRISTYIFACGIAAFSTAVVAQELPVGTQLPNGGVITGYGVGPKGNPLYLTTKGSQIQSVVDAKVQSSEDRRAERKAGAALARQLPVGTQLPNGAVITGYGVGPKGKPVYLTTKGEESQIAMNKKVLRAETDPAATKPAAARQTAATGKLPIGTQLPNGASITGYGVGPKGNPVYVTTNGEQLQSAVNASVASAKATAAPATIVKKPTVATAVPAPVAVKPH